MHHNHSLDENVESSSWGHPKTQVFMSVKVTSYKPLSMYVKGLAWVSPNSVGLLK